VLSECSAAIRSPPRLTSVERRRRWSKLEKSRLEARAIYKRSTCAMSHLMRCLTACPEIIRDVQKKRLQLMAFSNLGQGNLWLSHTPPENHCNALVATFQMTAFYKQATSVADTSIIEYYFVYQADIQNVGNSSERFCLALKRKRRKR
jgi:hypothetical protein